MESFYGYACTEEDLHYLADDLKVPYAGYRSAATQLTWQLNEQFHRLGPFRLMTVKIDSIMGYIFAIGVDNSAPEDLPYKLLANMEKVFGGGPMCFKLDPKQGPTTYVFEGETFEIGEILTSNLYKWPILY